MDWYMAVLRKYAVFSGRARRREFWMFTLVNIVISIILSIVDNILGWTFDTDIGILGGVYGLAVLIPSIAVAVRRLHDTGRTGWWLLIWLVPLIGLIVLIVFWAIEGERGPNQYGPDPKAGERGFAAGAPGAGGWPGSTPQPSVAPQAPADWYADPTGRHQHRYWDGRAWTEHAADNGVATVDPLTQATGVQATGPQVERPAWPTTPATPQTGVTSVAPGSESATVVAPIPAVMAPAPTVAEPDVPQPAAAPAEAAPAVSQPVAGPDVPAVEPAPAEPAFPAPMKTAPDEAATAVAEAPAPSVASPAQTLGTLEAPAPPEAPQAPAGSPPSPTV